MFDTQLFESEKYMTAYNPKDNSKSNGNRANINLEPISRFSDLDKYKQQ